MLADLWFVGIGGIALVLAGYYLRVSTGWVAIESTGIRTSRLIRGRFVPWSAVKAITPGTYTGKGGGITLARLSTIGGRSFILPTPRTTFPHGDSAFFKDIRRLQARAHAASWQ